MNVNWGDEDMDDVTMAPPPEKSLTEKELDKVKIQLAKARKEGNREEVKRLMSLIEASKVAHLTEAYRRETKKRGIDEVYGYRKKRGGKRRHRKTRKVRKTRRSRA